MTDNMEHTRPFTLLWENGKREIIHGTTIEDAFTRHGYGVEDIGRLKWHPGRSDSFLFINGRWKSFAGDSIGYRFALLLNPQPTTPPC